MGTASIILAVLSVIATIVGMGVSANNNAANIQAQKDINEQNIEAQKEINATNVEQANLAYNRSLPINQVRNLMGAGMSRAGALSALTGGGSYTAPVLSSAQSVAPQSHVDVGALSSMFDRFQNVPQNVEQQKLVDAQIADLKAQTQERINAGLRQQEEHNMNMWERSHGKKSVEMIDDLTSQIASMAADQGIDLDTIDSPQKMVKAFDLGKNEIYRTMPDSARSKLFESVRNQAAENRARQAQENANVAAQDAHEIAVKQLETMQQNIDDFKAAKNAREREYKARDLAAQVEIAMDKMNLSKAQLKASMSMEQRKDGSWRVTPHKGIQGVANEFWQTIGSVIGLEYIGDILAHIFKAAVK